jgi:hypothetical protein
MSEAQAQKNKRICQHLKNAVAKTALINDDPGLSREANL